MIKEKFNFLFQLKVICNHQTKYIAWEDIPLSNLENDPTQI